MNLLKNIDWSNPIPRGLAVLAFILVLVLAGAAFNKYHSWKGNRRAARGTRVTTTNKINPDRWKGPEAWYKFQLWLEPEALADFQEAAWIVCGDKPSLCPKIRERYHAAVERANLACVLDKSNCKEKKEPRISVWWATFASLLTALLGFFMGKTEIIKWLKN